MKTHNTRQSFIAKLHQISQWDVIVIGGGATGLGTAVESVTRGYKTLLLEKYDFAKGTSSRSTKLVHGGVRYLAQGNLPLVREALHERGLLRQNAPHLVKDLTFVVPGYSWSSQIFYGAGLKLYDLLSGRLSLGDSQFLSQQKTHDRLPTLNLNGLKGGIAYHDGQFDDARLAITLLQTLLDYDGLALNYFPIVEFLKQEGQIIGVRAQDTETGDSFELRSNIVINATGVFVDSVRQMDDPNTISMLSPSQGIHLVVDRHFLPGDTALMIPKTEDGRVLFAIPWHGKVLIGTTDTPIETVSYEPRPLQNEVDFILRTIAHYLTPTPTQQDILSVFVGLRPLVKMKGATSTASLSREHVIQVSPSGLLTVTGGKWTTYRKMGEAVVDRAIQETTLPFQPSVTANLRLHGWTPSISSEVFSIYGNDAANIQTLPGATIQLHPRLPYVEAEVRWAARYELARTVEDVLARRTRSLFLDAIASIEASPRVAALMAEELEFDSAWQHQQIEAYHSLAKGYLLQHPNRIT